MNSEEIQEKLQDAEARQTQLQGELDEARDSLRLAQHSYAENLSPAQLARLKGAQSRYDALHGAVEIADETVSTLQAQHAEAQEKEANEELLVALATIAENANEQLAAFLAAREEEEKSRRHYARATCAAFLELCAFRRSFMHAANPLAPLIHIRPHTFFAPLDMPEKQAARAAKLQAGEDLKRELENRIGSLDGICNYFDLRGEVETGISQLANLPSLDSMEFEPSAASDEPEWAESEDIEPALVGMA
jgi:hypothetical protein